MSALRSTASMYHSYAQSSPQRCPCSILAWSGTKGPSGIGPSLQGSSAAIDVSPPQPSRALRRKPEPRQVARARFPRAPCTRTAKFMTLWSVKDNHHISDRQQPFLRPSQLTVAMAPKKSAKTADSINAKLALTIKVRIPGHCSCAKPLSTDTSSSPARSLSATSPPSRPCAPARPNSSSSPATRLPCARASSSTTACSPRPLSTTSPATTYVPHKFAWRRSLHS